MTEHIQTLQRSLGNYLLQHLLWSLRVSHRLTLDKQGYNKIVRCSTRLLEEVVHGHLAELRWGVHHTHSVLIVQQDHKVFQRLARAGWTHVSNILETWKTTWMFQWTVLIFHIWKLIWIGVEYSRQYTLHKFSYQIKLNKMLCITYAWMYHMNYEGVKKYSTG